MPLIKRYRVQEPSVKLTIQVQHKEYSNRNGNSQYLKSAVASILLTWKKFGTSRTHSRAVQSREKGYKRPNQEPSGYCGWAPEDLQRKMSHPLMSQRSPNACKGCDIIPKVTWGCNCCQICFHWALNKLRIEYFADSKMWNTVFHTSALN